MSPGESKKGLRSTVLFAVNAPQDVIERLDQAASERSWKNKLLRCDSYISNIRRPFFMGAIKASEASIAFIDFDKSTEQAIESAQYLTQAFPGKITVVALTKSRDSGNILSAMRAGCSEFLNMPLQNEALAEVFERLEKRLLSNPSDESQAGTVISLFGVKGGVGSTALAAHLASYLANCYRKRTLLIDNHAELGHAAIYLGVNGNQSLFQDVVRNVDRLDSELLRGFLAEHSSGLSILTSPDICGSARESDGDAVAKTIEFLRGEFDYIVADCDIASEERSLPFIVASEYIYLVATPEVSAIRDLSRHIDRINLLGPASEGVQLVLNRISGSDVIQVEEIERTTRLSIAVRIPADNHEFARACNLGEPLYPNGRSGLAARLSEWAAQIAGVQPFLGEERRGKSLRSLWKPSANGLLGKKGFAYNERH